MISNSVKFLLNDKILEIKNPDPNQTILNYIRTELKKTGNKEGCSEGGCGACTIVLGELVNNNKIKYNSINSCISFVPSLNGKQLLIVEDLVQKPTLYCVLFFQKVQASIKLPRGYLQETS